jgi:hypothetical protein
MAISVKIGTGTGIAIYSGEVLFFLNFNARKRQTIRKAGTQSH